MQYKEQIITLIKEKPKHFSKIIKNNNELFSLVKDCYGSSVSEQIYNYLNPNQHTCAYNNTKQFASINDGYRNCGPANKCQCTREQVSTAVSTSKKQYTTEKKEQIQEKRKSTCLEIYGVDNVGQTQKAISAHKELYNNTQAVDNITQKIKQTKKEKYGDENYNNIEQIKKTSKLTPAYQIAKFPDKKLIELKEKDTLLNWYMTYTIDEIAEFCKVHKHTIYRYLTEHNIREPYKSSFEQEIVNFLTQQNITNIVRNSRKILPSKKELDIYLPEFNIAIEYNGIYWHHDKIPHIDKMYHYNKFIECENNGIHLITIFSNIWDTKKDIIKTAILHKLKMHSICKIAARKCQVRIITNKECKQLLEDHHLQGYVPSQLPYGLFYNNELVAAMTFNAPRNGIGKQDIAAYELVRYVSKYHIVGGASKLLKAFITSYNPSTIVSYSANEWSTGNLYQQLGFTLDVIVKPGYWYIKPKENKLYHRYNFSKHRLVELGYDKNLSESQIVDQMGLLRVWDCGKKRWILKLR